MIGLPPFETPCYQTNPILYPIVIEASFYKFTGASGFVIKIAPFPGSDTSELPTMFIACMVANTLEPQFRLNGAAISVETGIIQYKLPITVV